MCETSRQHPGTALPAQDSGTTGADGVSKKLVEHVRDALQHFFDLGYLQEHPLAQVQDAQTTHSVEVAGQRLRRNLAAAIESLNPGFSVPLRAPQARLHNLLVLHYLEGMTVQEAAYKLGVGRRQAHRDLRRAVESVAAVLSGQRLVAASAQRQDAQTSSVCAEIGRWVDRPSRTDLRTLLENALTTVAPLAAQRQITLDVCMPAEPVAILVDMGIAEQVLVSVLSRAISHACSGPLDLLLSADQVTLTLNYYPAPEFASAPAFPAVATQLADRLGWGMEWVDEAQGLRTIRFAIKAFGPTIVVIDDNEDLVELFDRYLTDQACQVVAATNGQDGLRMAQQLVPDAVVLDIMMPEMHGWDVLQQLRAHPRTARIPVVICSVINDPDLALCLGASLVLPKPISRTDVLTALHHVGVL